MRFKEGWILFLFFIVILLPLIMTLIGEVSVINDYSHIKKYPQGGQSNPIRFQVIGDFGDINSETPPINDTKPVIHVSDVMQERALTSPINFILSVGDNSYPHAYANFDQVLYDLMYNVFDKTGLRGKPWYAILGNHDCVENPEYEVHANKLYTMWNMPSNYYNFTFPIDNGKSVGFALLDGCILTGSDTQLINTQYSWLKTVLNSTAQNPNVVWSFVVIHMPLWSPGQYHGDNEFLKQTLYPILSEYKVDLAITGHEHLMAHYASQIIDGKPEPYIPLPDINFTCNMDEFIPYGEASDWMQGEAIHEILQGAGGRDLYETCPNKTTQMADLLFAYSSYGFSEVYVDSKNVQIDYFNISGIEPIYTVRIRRDI